MKQLPLRLSVVSLPSATDDEEKRKKHHPPTRDETKLLAVKVNSSVFFFFSLWANWEAELCCKRNAGLKAKVFVFYFSVPSRILLFVENTEKSSLRTVSSRSGYDMRTQLVKVFVVSSFNPLVLSKSVIELHFIEQEHGDTERSRMMMMMMMMSSMWRPPTAEVTWIDIDSVTVYVFEESTWSKNYVILLLLL